MNNCCYQEIFPDCDLRRWETQPTSYIADAENYYTKVEIDTKLEDIVESGCCITPQEVDEKIDAAISGIDLSDYATQQWVEDKHYISGVDLSNYATKSEIPTVPTKVSAFENDVPYLTEHQSLSGYATEQWVTNQGYLTEHQHLKTINNESLIGDGNIVISGGTSITVDPTLNSGSTNPVVNSAITIAINAKADKTEIPDVSNLQPKLTAGNNISINNNVISATDTKYTAGNGINISTANVISTIVDASLSSSSKNAVSNSAITASLNTKAASSAVTDLQNTVNTIQNTVNTHTSNTSIHMTSGNVETQIVNHFWCGSEQQWAQISGSTQNNILYLVY